jgi:hypothetical protein
MGEKRNLLGETLTFLAAVGKSPRDVLWVGSEDGRYALSWEEFAQIADVEYDPGYGAQKIAVDLVVVGDGWWLERWEYDGAEGWSFKECPVRQPDAEPFRAVKGDLWPRLAWLQEHQPQDVVLEGGED